MSHDLPDGHEPDSTHPIRGEFDRAETELVHLMIVHPRYMPHLISGQKTVESRLGRDRRAPFGHARAGELVYLKTTGGNVFGAAKIERVDFFESLTPDDVSRLRDTYESRVRGGDEYWQSKADANYATMIWLGPVRPVTDFSRIPTDLLKPSRNAWCSTQVNSAQGTRHAA